MQTYGDGDPAIPVAVQAAHDAAVAAGELLYIDPRTGGMVVTALRLGEQDSCCGNGCRHCPWPRSRQLDAGRSPVRPADDAPGRRRPHAQP